MSVSLTRRDFVAVTLLMLFALVVRWPGMLNELWLDEVWSLTNALSARSWIDLFTNYRIDNNHHLNSLWLYAVGSGGSAPVYRLFSFACGIASVGVAYVLGRQQDRVHAVITAAVFGLSFPLVYYSSEARGYAPVVFFTVTAWLSLRHFIATNARGVGIAFWICCLLGVMAHPTFLEFFLAALVWCDIHAERSSKSVRAATRTTVTAFALPAVLFVLYYLLALRGTAIAGGPRSPIATIIAQVLSLLAGGPSAGWLMWAAAGIVVTLFALSVAAAFRRHDDIWLLYVMACLALPALFLLIQPSGASYTRYFLVPGVFVLLAISDSLALAVEAGGFRRAGAIIAIIAMAAGCLVNVQELYALGRGRYDIAVRRMLAAQTPVVSVASAPEFTLHDFRVEMLMRYYARVLGAPDRVRYVTEDQYSAQGTDWMIRENIGAAAPRSADLIDRFGNHYSFDGEYRAAPLAGIAWWVYRRR